MVIVADTSAWVEYFRGSGHPVARRLKALLATRGELAVTETVLMEVMAGTRSGTTLEAIRAQLVDLPILRLEGIEDFEQAAAIYRSCREAGHTLRSQLDLLIAVPTIRHRASLLHNDRDFQVIARHSALKLEPPIAVPEDGSPELRERAGRYARRSDRKRPRTARRSRPPLPARRSVS